MPYPDEAVEYLDLLRDLGVSEWMIQVERDAWILIAARWPERMPAWMAEKRAQFEDPLVVRLYRILDDPMEWSADDPRLVEFADVLAEIADRSESLGELERQDQELDDLPFSTCSTPYPSSSRRSPSACRNCWKSAAGPAGPD